MRFWSLCRLVVLDLLHGLAVILLTDFLRVKGMRPDIGHALAGLECGRGLERGGAGCARQLQHLMERALAGQEEMQRAHADAQGQLALGLAALEAALGDIAPGRGQVLQHVLAEALGRGQA